MKKKKTISYAGLGQRKIKIFVYRKQKTVEGVHIAKGKVSSFEIFDLQGIGLALRQALADYQVGLPAVPDRPDGAWPELFIAAGVRNWTEYGQGAKSVSAKLQDRVITLMPWKNIGGRARFDPLEGLDHTIPEGVSNGELGAAVIATFDDAR